MLLWLQFQTELTNRIGRAYKVGHERDLSACKNNSECRRRKPNTPILGQPNGEIRLNPLKKGDIPIAIHNSTLTIS